jgi:hypothetical protein
VVSESESKGGAKMTEITYDAHGRLVYNPEFHPNHGKSFTTDDLVYLCKYNDIDGPKLMAMALGKTEGTVANKVGDLRKSGLYQTFKEMPDELWEKILERMG